jgi:hypothetical protein
MINLFTAAMAQGELSSCCFCIIVITKIFAEGIWDKIFDTETIAALGRALQGALGDESFGVRRSAVKILTAAMAQGVLCCFHRIFKLKYL